MTRTATNRTMCMCMMKPNGNRLIIRYPTRGFFRDDETRFPEACRQVSGFFCFSVPGSRFLLKFALYWYKIELNLNNSEKGE